MKWDDNKVGMVSITLIIYYTAMMALENWFCYIFYIYFLLSLFDNIVRDVYSTLTFVYSIFRVEYPVWSCE
jgi:hypothetical protein